MEDRIGHHDGAIADYSKAIELDPNFTKAWWGRAIAKQNKGDWAGVITDDTEAIRRDPKLGSRLTTDVVLLTRIRRTSKPLSTTSTLLSPSTRDWPRSGFTAPSSKVAAKIGLAPSPTTARP